LCNPENTKCSWFSIRLKISLKLAPMLSADVPVLSEWFGDWFGYMYEV